MSYLKLFARFCLFYLDSIFQISLHHWSSVWLIFLFHSILFRTFQQLTMIYRTKNRCLSLVFKVLLDMTLNWPFLMCSQLFFIHFSQAEIFTSHHIVMYFTTSLMLLFFFFMLYWESLPSMLLIFSFVLFWLCHKAYGILVPWPEIEPTPPALEAQSLNHWTAREVPF